MAFMHVLIRYGEIGLKGQNRFLFERQLARNIEFQARKKGLDVSVIRKRGRLLLVISEDERDIVCEVLKRVFGIVSFSFAHEVALDMDAIKQKSLELALGASSFRVSCKRSKKYLMRSDLMQQEVGAYIVEHTSLPVSLKDPAVNVQIEISDSAYVFTQKHAGLGGMPAGSQGRVKLLVNDRLSALIGYLLMKRGCYIKLVYNGDLLPEYLYVIKRLEPYAPFDLKLQLFEECDIEPLGVGDTYEDFKTYDSFVLRPLIGYTHAEALSMEEECL